MDYWSADIINKVDRYVDQHYSLEYKANAKSMYAIANTMTARVLLEFHNNAGCRLKFTEREVAELSRVAGIDE
jgi:hypothetical protein